MSIDHDQIIKTLIQAFFREFMELFFPEEARLIDSSRVEFLREEYFTDLPRGKRRLLDLVVKVGLLAGGEKFVLVARRRSRNCPLETLSPDRPSRTRGRWSNLRRTTSSFE
jgi:hypothetical protein